MKCTECGIDVPLQDFRYLYNARMDASISLRQCPKCQEWLAVDELNGIVKQKVEPGQTPWGKSAGIENLAEDALV